MKSLTVLKVVAPVHAAAVCLQPVLAGAYLNGSGSTLRIWTWRPAARVRRTDRTAESEAVAA